MVAVSGNAAPPGNGGCYQGGQVAGWLVPGTGSAGQNVHQEVNMWICESPLLPGIDAGKLTYEVPFGGGPGSARFNWSDGSVSNANGGGNNLWSITDGPAAGHSIQLNLIDDRTTDANGDISDVYIFQSAIFMS
ncbi:hypothetical protein [Nocardia concava]|uniref:hypothetical protein n=1 Tax=Nocardia concava TaxID=257281 RepID=UPI000593D92B|nr:hypothetical protein [Nocardia concava]